MVRYRYHIRLMATALTGAGVLLAGGILLLACNLVRFGFVEQEAEIRHLALLYGWGFPLASIFLWAPLFAEEQEEGVLQWLFALPFHRVLWLAERWMLGMLLTASLYFGSAAVLDRVVLELPWRYFAVDLFVPAVWVGQLALLAALIFRSTAGGLGAALGYWCLEVLSRGAVTGDAYLFRAAASGQSSGTVFLAGYVGLAAVCTAGCALLLRPGFWRK